MAIGVIADNTVAQPQDVAHAEVCPEKLFDFPASQLRIAVGIEQAGLGGQQSSPSVHIDGATLQHDTGLEHGKAQLFGDPGRYDVVQIVRRILPTPGVEPPIDDGLRMLRIRPLNEDRSMISTPGVVRGVKVEEHVAGVGAAIGQKPPDLVFHCGPGHVDMDFLVVGQETDHPGEDPGNRSELPRPGRLFMRPAQPGAAVELPLGRHPVAQLSGSGGACFQSR